MIPYPLFIVLLDTVPQTSAEQQLHMTQAVTHGYLSATSPGDPSVQSANALLIDQAFPLHDGRPRLTTQDPVTLIANDRAWEKHGGLWLLERE